MQTWNCVAIFLGKMTVISNQKTGTMKERMTGRFDAINIQKVQVRRSSVLCVLYELLEYGKGRSVSMQELLYSINLRFLRRINACGESRGHSFVAFATSIAQKLFA